MAAHRGAIARVVAPHFFSSRRTVAGAIYGTVSVTALIAGASHDEDSAGRLLLFATSASLVVWAVHVYAFVLADIGPSAQPWRTALRHGLHREIGVFQGVLVPLLVLFGGVIGVLSDHRAIVWSLWSGALILFLLPFVWLRRDGAAWWRCLAAASVGGLLGLVLTSVKVLLH